MRKSLTIKEQLKCRMDELANIIAINHHNSGIILNPTPITLGIRSVRCGSILITSRFQQSMYYHILHQKLVKHVASKFKIRASVVHHTVNWYVMCKARKESRLGQRIFMTKWVSGDTSTGTVMVKRK